MLTMIWVLGCVILIGAKQLEVDLPYTMCWILFGLGMAVELVKGFWRD